MQISISIYVHPPPASPAAPQRSRVTIALDELLEQYTGLTPVDIAAHIHTLCDDQHLDREAVARLLAKYGGPRVDVAQALTDLFGDEQPDLTPGARRLRAALIRFVVCVLDGLVARDG